MLDRPTHRAQSTWTDQRAAVLKELWQANAPIGDIVRALGATRSAVEAKAHRMGLPPRLVGTAGNIVRKAARKNGAANGYGFAINKARKDGLSLHEAMEYMFARNQPEPTGPEWEPLPGTTPISLMDLPDRRFVVCRWPVTGGYCGQPSGARTYCEHHHARAYRGAAE